MKKLFTLILFSSLACAYAATPTGSCGALIDITPKNIDPVAAGQSYGANVLVVINFDTGQITGNANVAKYPNNYSTPSTSSVFPSFSSNVLGPTKFFLSQGPIPSTWTLTAPGWVQMNILPVNSNNTYLIQIQGDRGTGICQAM